MAATTSSLTGPLSAVDQIIEDWSKPSPSRAISFAYRGGGHRHSPIRPYFRRSPGTEPDLARRPLLVVASEVDFDSTLVGGSSKLIEAIVGSPELEAWQVKPTDSLAADADKINLVQEDES